MKRTRCVLRFALILSLLLFTPSLLSAGVSSVHLITLDDEIINPITAEYITRSIERAAKEDAACLVIQLDTPGGLLNSTRQIVKTMMASPVPIIVYVAPSGARAGSAGVFITLASDIAAMAPSTNIGAAHPVTVGQDGRSVKKTLRGLKDLLGGAKEDRPARSRKEADEDRDIMGEKIMSDTLAWVRSIANERGRNVKWAERSVTESLSSSEEEALDKKVIDFVASDVSDLLIKSDGRLIQRLGRMRMETAGARVQEFPLSTRQKLLLVLTNPNVAYIFMMLGFYGLLFEVTHPGFGFPGIAGLISIIMALYAFQTLPTNFAGLALIALALLLFIGETQVPSFGLFTVGGLISMLLGSLMLIETPYEFLQISLWVIVPVVLSTAIVTIFLVNLVLRVHRRKPAMAEGGLVGEIGRARFAFGPGAGKVDVHGEIWNAESDKRIKKGQEVRVVAIERMKLKVEQVSQGSAVTKR